MGASFCLFGQVYLPLGDKPRSSFLLINFLACLELKLRFKTPTFELHETCDLLSGQILVSHKSAAD